MQKLYDHDDIIDNIIDFISFFPNTHHKLEIYEHPIIDLLGIGYENRANVNEIYDEFIDNIFHEKTKTIRLDLSDPELEDKLCSFYQCEALDNADIYLSLNDFSSAYYRSEKYLNHICGMLFDYDYKDVCRDETNVYGRKFESFEDFQNEIVNTIRTLPIKPFYILNSGHGIQFLYFFNDIPKMSLDEYKKIQATIKYAFDEKIQLRHDRKADLLTQIFRIPGTNNCKDLNNNYDKLKKELLEMGHFTNYEVARRIPTTYLSFTGKFCKWKDLLECFEVEKYINTDIVQKCKNADKEYKAQFKPSKSKIKKEKIKKEIIQRTERPKETVVIPIKHIKEKKQNQTITTEINRPKPDIIMFISPALKLHHKIQVVRLEKLAELRDYIMPGLNDLFLLIYFNSLFISTDEQTAIDKTLLMSKKLNHNINETISKIINHTASKTGIYNYSWERTIEDLEITNDELIQLDSSAKKQSEIELDKKIVKLYLSNLSLRKIAKAISTDKHKYTEKKIRDTLKRLKTKDDLSITRETHFEDIAFEENAKYRKGNYSKNKVNCNIAKYNDTKYQNQYQRQL